MNAAATSSAPESPEKVFALLVDRLRDECLRVYGERMVSLVIFGSVGRGVMRPDSDIDFLLVAAPLPAGRIPRVREFDEVEERLKGDLEAAAASSIDTRLSPVFKTPTEVRAGSPLFLDMVEDARIVLDREGFFAAELERLRDRLAKLGAKRVWSANAWYWDLKPDYKPGEVFEI